MQRVSTGLIRYILCSANETQFFSAFAFSDGSGEDTRLLRPARAGSGAAAATVNTRRLGFKQWPGVFVALRLVLTVALVAAATLPLNSMQLGTVIDRLGKRAGINAAGETDGSRVAAGLKEALQIGATNAIARAGAVDGFFRNQAIRILFPDRLRTLEKGLRAAGLGSKVDEFELSMNRAAEKAAPEARAIFSSAIREITIDDGRRILTGGDTAATEYFKGKTAASLSAAFRPIVARVTSETGVSRQYKQLSAGIPSLPFLNRQSLDIDDYVVSKTLDGLFHVLGEEEKKIRTDPAARVTSLLKDVFRK